MAEMTRQEHLELAKKRALEYVDRGDLDQAWASIASDLQKHPDTQRHAGLELGTALMIHGHLSTPERMRQWIEGFR